MTYTVINTNDEGEGSLRQAIIDANENDGPDSIYFNIPSEDPQFDGTCWRIAPLTQLPTLSDDFTCIVGESQSLNQSNSNINGPEIYLDGSNCEASSKGLDLNSLGNRVTSLIVSNFAKSGIDVRDDNNIVQGCFIGLSPAGTDTMPNQIGIRVLNCKNNLIGGSTEQERNIISGNGENGIDIQNSPYTLIQGNYIGTDYSGLLAVPNQESGIYLSKSSQCQIGSVDSNGGNVVSGNLEHGIGLYTDSDSVLVENNIIGLNASGDDTLCNSENGLVAYGSSHHKFINNIISANSKNGIYCTRSDSLTIQRNLIGTDKSQLIALGNKKDGIYLSSQCYDYLIGGPDAEQANIISGNHEQGISLNASKSNGCHFHQITGNFIGCSKTGIPLGNGESGIRLKVNACHNQIGPDNIITANKKNGIYLSGSATQFNTITQNSIYNNSKGVYLYGTTNEDFDAPKIESTSPIAGIASPNSIVEIFSDSTDQGRIYEGRCIADESGNFEFGDDITGPYVTATATTDSGSTSQFSDPVMVEVTSGIIEQLSHNKKFTLYQNHPNPFNPITTITYDLAKQSNVQLMIYNMLGRKVYSKDLGFQNIGQHQIEWHGTNWAGSKVASGIYFYQIIIISQDSKRDQFQSIRKMVLMK